MATIRHPVTGVLMNEITLINHGKVSDDERRTARLLQTEGHPRWLVAAMLGRFPLAFEGVGGSPSDGRRPMGGHLAVRDAKADVRQFSMDDLFGPLDAEVADHDAAP
jgi:hypothetical protein